MLPSPLVRGISLLGGRPEDIALVVEGSGVRYSELSDLVADRGAYLGDTRRLVMLIATNTLESIVTYLAALAGGHVVLLVAGGDDEATRAHRSTLAERFDPDVIAHDGMGEWALEERRPGSRHEFHPELAMLASTSGSTGSPKLVRLSRENLLSNAAAIAEYLRLEPQDRAATTLPLQYCYGLSVVNSHLFAGASLLLTERSVTEEDFWTEAAEQQVTSFAGVPYTFELLEAGGFAERSLPSLRYLTQAGGRLAPDAVRRFGRLGAERGFDFYVMYGQTEATARMAYLPPELVESSAGAIGIPIPGGSFRIDAGEGVDAAPGDSGELVYGGPNVMLGYAESPEDFALGRTVHELRTGDVARQRDDGLLEIVGRMNRFVKVFGLRLDLDRVEQLLAAEGFVARAASADERLLLFTTADRTSQLARERAAALLGIPAHVIRAYAVAEFPRTSNGKPDNAALVRFAKLQDRATSEGGHGPGRATSAPTPDRLRELFATLLAQPDVGVDDSFSGLGGDSLGYIEVSLRLEALLGVLPREWPTLTIRELAALGAPTDAGRATPGKTPQKRARAFGARLVQVDTSVALRAVAIVLVVGTHADLFMLKGGAHLLLAVVGYNLARFQLAPAMPAAARARGLLRGALRITIPAVIWIGAVALITAQYQPTTALLVNNLVPSDGRWNEQWQFWFLEATVWSLIGLAGLFALRFVDRLERGAPFAFALTVLAVALAVRFAVVGLHAEYVERYTAVAVFWLIALGWLASRATTTARRLVVSIIAIVSSVGFFGDPLREAIVAVGIVVLVWLPTLRLPRRIVPVIATLAGASLFIYLTHWQVYPPFEQSAPWLGTLLSLLVGVVAWRVHAFASGRLTRWRSVTPIAADRPTREPVRIDA